MLHEGGCPEIQKACHSEWSFAEERWGRNGVEESPTSSSGAGGWLNRGPLAHRLRPWDIGDSSTSFPPPAPAGNCAQNDTPFDFRSSLCDVLQVNRHPVVAISHSPPCRSPRISPTTFFLSFPNSVWECQCGRNSVSKAGRSLWTGALTGQRSLRGQVRSQTEFGNEGENFG